MLPALIVDDVDADVVDAALPLAPGCPAAAAAAVVDDALPLAPGCPSAAAVAATAHK